MSQNTPHHLPNPTTDAAQISRAKRMLSLRKRRGKISPSLPEDASLEAQISALTQEVKTLNAHRFIKVQNSTPRLLTLNFLRGLAFGLGSVIGASALVSILAFMLAQVDFVPIIGEWARDIADMIRTPVE